MTDDQCFAVGEIAIMCNLHFSHAHWNGLECEIRGPLQQQVHTRDAFGQYESFSYRCLCPDGREHPVRPCYLRKRPQPPDWLALASKQTVADGIDIKSPEYS